MPAITAPKGKGGVAVGDVRERGDKHIMDLDFAVPRVVPVLR
jgi:hypothetical protein